MNLWYVLYFLAAQNMYDYACFVVQSYSRFQIGLCLNWNVRVSYIQSLNFEDYVVASLYIIANK